jgi:hypothetical protein
MPNAAREVNAASYTDNGDGTVIDDVTSLMWEQAPDNGGLFWAAAVSRCKQLKTGGHNDWRLPTLIELVSLIDYGAEQTPGAQVSLIDAKAFPNMTAGLYWTATAAPGSSKFAWEVNFNNGVTNADSTAGANTAVVCVR